MGRGGCREGEKKVGKATKRKQNPASLSREKQMGENKKHKKKERRNPTPPPTHYRFTEHSFPSNPKMSGTNGKENPVNDLL